MISSAHPAKYFVGALFFGPAFADSILLDQIVHDRLSIGAESVVLSVRSLSSGSGDKLARFEIFHSCSFWEYLLQLIEIKLEFFILWVFDFLFLFDLRSRVDE